MHYTYLIPNGTPPCSTLTNAATCAEQCWPSTRSRRRSAGGWRLLPHPPDRLHLSGPELPRRSQDLPLLAGPLQPLLRPPLDGLKFLVCHPGREHHQHLPEEGLGTTFVGLQVAGPLGLRLGQGTNLHPPPGPAVRRWTVRCLARSVRCDRWRPPLGCRRRPGGRRAGAIPGALEYR